MTPFLRLLRRMKKTYFRILNNRSSAIFRHKTPPMKSKQHASIFFQPLTSCRRFHGFVQVSGPSGIADKLGQHSSGGFSTTVKADFELPSFTRTKFGMSRRRCLQLERRTRVREGDNKGKVSDRARRERERETWIKRALAAVVAVAGSDYL